MLNKRKVKTSEVAAVANANNDPHLQAEIDGLRLDIDEALSQKSHVETESDTEVKSRMLRAIANNAAAIFTATMKEETSKKRWRNFFMLFFVCLLVISLTLFIIGIILDSTTDWFNLSLEVIVGAFAYFLTNIFAVINLMTKYVNNTRYMDIFKTISDGLLIYLAKDNQSSSDAAGKDDK